MKANRRTWRAWIGRLLIVSLLLSLLAVFWPVQAMSGEAAVAPAAQPASPAEPEESWLITWDALTSGSGVNGGRRVNRQTRATASIVVNYYADDSSDYYVNEYTGTALVDWYNEEACDDGGSYTYHERWEVTDPTKYSGNGPIPQIPGEGGVMPYKPVPWTPTAWTINLIILYPGNTPEAPGLLPTYHFRDIAYCGGGGENFSETYEGTEHLDNLTSKVRSPFNGDANGLFLYDVNTTINYTEAGVTYPLKIVEHLRVERLTGLDLRVREIEVTQGLQLHNTIPLVQGRRTIVRAYIGMGVNAGTIGNVTARLRGYDGATLLGELEPFNPVGWILARPSPDWLNLEDTLNFELPRSWTLRPSLRLEVEVNPAREISEVFYDNNTSSVELPLRDCRPITIGYLPIRYEPPALYPEGPGADIAAGQEFLRKVYPIADDELLYLPWPGMTWYGWLSGPDMAKEVEYGNMLLRSMAISMLLNTGPKVDRLIGWLPGTASPRLGGLADSIPGKVAWVEHLKNPKVWRNVFAHEVGHTYGVEHNGLTTGGYRWFDVYERSIKPPNATGNLRDFIYPYVEPEEAQWVSPSTYNFLYNVYCSPGAPAGAAAAPADDSDLLIVTGLASATDVPSGQLDPLFRADGTAFVPPDGAEYHVVLKGGATTLADYGFDVNVEVDAQIPYTPQVGSFALAVPYPAGLTRVDLTDRYGSILSSRVASAQPPVVTVQFPNSAGLTLSGVQTIQWTASDPDGNALTYSVRYSRDNGATWHGIGAGITGTSYNVDFDNIPGSAAARIQVLASDGFHTAADVSDQPFTVPAKPPVPFIIAPPDGAHFIAGETIKLQGYAVDLEEGVLGPGSLNWSSDLAGALGAGSTLEVTLPEGTHTITLSPAGSPASATTTIVVQPPGAGPYDNSVYLPLVLR